MKRQVVAIFDLDGTLARHDTYLAYLLGYLRSRPRRWSRTIPLPAAVFVHKAGWRDNTWLKTRFLRSILGGETLTQLRGWTEQFLDTLQTDGLRAGGLRQLREHRDAGHETVLMSASLDIYVQPLAGRLGFDRCICSRVELDGEGRITGRLVGANCHGLEKLRQGKTIIGDRRDNFKVFAYADHPTDEPLLRWADHGFVVSGRSTAPRFGSGLEVVRW